MLKLTSLIAGCLNQDNMGGIFNQLIAFFLVLSYL